MKLPGIWAKPRAKPAMGIDYQEAEKASVTLGDGTQQRRRSTNKRLRQAVHRHKPVARQGIQERLFTLAFSGLVYPQIWEDRVVDLEALRLQDGERLIAIASGGCNVLSYLAAAPITSRPSISIPRTSRSTS